MHEYYKERIRERLADLLFPQYQSAYQEKYIAQNSTALRADRQRAMFLFALHQEPEVFLTLKLNQQLSEVVMRDRLRRFDAVLNRFFLGRRWHRYPSEERVWYVGFVERDRDGSGSAHVHYLMRPPNRGKRLPRRMLRRSLSILLTHEVRKRCNRVAPAGDVNTFPIDDGRPVSYAMKDLKREWNSDRLVPVQRVPPPPCARLLASWCIRPARGSNTYPTKL